MIQCKAGLKEIQTSGYNMATFGLILNYYQLPSLSHLFSLKRCFLFSTKTHTGFLLCRTSRGCATPATEPSSELIGIRVPVGLETYSVIHSKEITNASFQ